MVKQKDPIWNFFAVVEQDNKTSAIYAIFAINAINAGKYQWHGKYAYLPAFLQPCLNVICDMNHVMEKPVCVSLSHG